MSDTPFVLRTTHVVDPDRVDQLRAAAAEYSTFTRTSEPQLLAHLSFLDEEATTLTMLHVFADSSAAERHLSVAGDLIARGIALTAGNSLVEVSGGSPGPVLTQLLEHNRQNGTPVHAGGVTVSGFARSPAG